METLTRTVDALMLLYVWPTSSRWASASLALNLAINMQMNVPVCSQSLDYLHLAWLPYMGSIKAAGEAVHLHKSVCCQVSCLYHRHVTAPPVVQLPVSLARVVRPSHIGTMYFGLTTHPCTRGSCKVSIANHFCSNMCSSPHTHSYTLWHSFTSMPYP